MNTLPSTTIPPRVPSQHARGRHLIWTLLAVTVMLAGLTYGHSAARADPTTHSPLVVTNCFPAPANNHAAYMLIANNKKYGTAWMHGYHLAATTLHHGTITRTRLVVPFRLSAWSQTGWVVWLSPHRIKSCSFTILWGK